MNSVKLTKARLVPQTGDPIEVQFNPVSLVYEVSNSLAQQNRDATRRQLVTQSNARSLGGAAVRLDDDRRIGARADAADQTPDASR